MHCIRVPQTLPRPGKQGKAGLRFCVQKVAKKLWEFGPEDLAASTAVAGQEFFASFFQKEALPCL
jgi:hypothetical protein